MGLRGMASAFETRLGAVLAACAAVAFATSQLSAHIPPNVPLLAAAAAVVTAALLVPAPHRRLAAILGAAVAGLAAAHLLLRPGMPQVHDVDHVWGLWAYARSVHRGNVLPSWIPDLAAGMPLLQFYGPVSFLQALPGIAAGLSPVGLWKEAMTQDAVLAALSALFGARLLGAGWRGAFVAACALAFAPWRLAVFHFRGALGEATAFVFAPVVAAAGLVMLRAPGRAPALALAIATALLIPTHLITLFCLAVAFVPAAIAQEIARRGELTAPRVRRAGIAAAPALVGAALVAAWWVPAVVEGRYTSLPLQTETHRYFVYHEHGLDLHDLADRRAWDTSRSSLKRSDRAAGKEGEQMPFYAGTVLFGVALTAPWWSRSRATWGPAAGALAALLFATAPAADLMTHLPLFGKIQFPWRFLSAGSVFAALAVGLGVCARIETASGWKRLLVLLALPAALIADAAPYTGAAGWVAPYRGLTHWVAVGGHRLSEPFDVAMRAVPQPAPESGGWGRVGGLYLPPDDLRTDVALFFLPYVEWTTPPFYRGFLNTRDPREFGDGSVSWFFLPNRESPIPIPAQPYATLERGGQMTAVAGTERGSGRVRLTADVPEGGARLVVRELAFLGWIARVDGHEAPIVPTAKGFMAVDLSAGPHEVVLEYTHGTPARRAGLVLSVLALAVGTFLVSWKRGRALSWNA